MNLVTNALRHTAYLVCLSGLLLAAPAWGQILAWDMAGNSGNEVSVNSTTTAGGLSTATVGRGAGLDPSGLANAFSSSNFTANGDFSDAVANDDYIEFEIDAQSGFEFSLSTLDANFRRSGTGPNNFQWQYSVNGGGFVNIGSSFEFTSTATNGVAQDQIDLSGIGDLQDVDDETTVTIRLYGWGASSTGGTFAIGRLSGNDLAIGGTVGAIPGAGPSIAHTPLGNTSSADDRTATATITGNNLVTAGDNRPAIWFQVDGGGFSSAYFTDQTADEFEFTIPGQAIGSTVDYYIAAADADDVTTHPAGGSGENPPGSTPPGDFHTYDIEMAPGLRVWTGSGDGTSWSDAENWDPEAVPGEGDDVLLDNSTVAGSYTVLLPSGTVSTIVATVEIEPANPASPITLHLPSDNTANPGLRVTATGDALHIHDGGILRNSTTAGSGSGVDLTASGATIRIENGGRYVHNTVRAHATALVAKLSTAEGTETGVFEFDVPGSGAYTISTSGRTYGSMQLSSTDAGRTYQVNVTGAGTVRGHLVIDADFSLEAPLTVHQTLDLVGGTLTIEQPEDRPFTLASAADRTATITNGAGTVVGDVTYQRHYAFDESGWRMIGSPFAAIMFATLRESGFHTQGAAGAEHTAGEPILYRYDPTEPEWDAIASYDTPFEAGRGYIFYMFEEFDLETLLPNTWEIAGAENPEPVTVPLNFETGESDQSFNLVSNPHAGNLDWNEVDASNVSATYHVWDPDQGVYLSFQSPNVDSGAGQFIAPFQGFWVQATGAGASMTVEYDMKDNTGSPVYLGRPATEPPAYVLFELEGEGLMAARPIMVFREGAEVGEDIYDASLLNPLSADFASAWFEDELDRRMIFDARPPEGTQDFQLGVGTTSTGSYALSWPTWQEVPDHWVLTLTDHDTGQVVDLRDESSYTFSLSANEAARPADERALPVASSALATGDTRFTVTVRTQPVSSDPGASEYAFGLEAAYPNPFSGAATVAFTLPEASDVQLAVYDVLGRRVATLAAGEHAAGSHTATLDGTALASGVYVVRLVAGEHAAAHRVTVVR